DRGISDRKRETAFRVQDFASRLRQVRTQEPSDLFASLPFVEFALNLFFDFRLREFVEEASNDGLSLGRPPGAHSVEVGLDGKMHGRTELHAGDGFFRDSPIATQLVCQGTT